MKLEQKKIIVLGHKGMLGQMITAYFKDKVDEIITIAYRFNNEEKWLFIDKIRKYPNAIIFNAIGKIKQKTEDDFELLMANAILPLELNNHLLPNQILIHPSTDCVFSGNTQTPYRLINESDARDTYGWSKRLGEIALQNRRNSIIFRVSIIGEEKNNSGKGLLSWFLLNKPKAKLKGFTNHKWNGITTLEWCKQVHYFLRNKKSNDKEFGIIQLGTKEYYTKYEMLLLFQDVYGTEFEISEFETPENTDKRLYPDIVSKPLKEQLTEMKNFCSANF